MKARERGAAPWGKVEFGRFYERVWPSLVRSLTVRFGAELGTEASQAAVAWAWEHPAKVRAIESPVSYLHRVGASKIRRELTRRAVAADAADWAVDETFPDLDLVEALKRLTVRQRSAVLLVHGYGWTRAAVADALDISESTVREHLASGERRLSAELGEELPQNDNEVSR